MYRTDSRPTMPVSEAKLVAETGRDWEAWLTILDRWGARDKKHSEVAAYLMEKHSVAGWYAQAITVGFERARLNRKKHQQAGGGFTIYASKTVAVPAAVAFDAFVDARKRRRWLTDGKMKIRTSQAGRNARFNWEDGTSRVVAFFEAKAASKTTISVSHERLPDPDEAETAKAAWRRRLTDLKAYLES